VRLDPDACWGIVGRARHGVLGTIHGERGVDAVPVVFAVLTNRTVIIPVDTVQPKTTTRLQRLANIAADPRCVLLVDRYDDDWTELWWVRIHATAAGAEPTPDHLAALGKRYPRYREDGAVVSVLVLTPTAITGWSP
jgi:PPOX class probable F420-dependent enzyme